jgi:hypothetical protein
LYPRVRVATANQMITYPSVDCGCAVRRRALDTRAVRWWCCRHEKGRLAGGGKAPCGLSVCYKRHTSRSAGRDDPAATHEVNARGVRRFRVGAAPNPRPRIVLSLSPDREVSNDVRGSEMRPVTASNETRGTSLCGAKGTKGHLLYDLFLVGQRTQRAPCAIQSELRHPLPTSRRVPHLL